MADCEELFSIMGTIFPNRVRILLSDGRIDGMSGRFAFDTLQQMGRAIEADCPAHASFAVEEAAAGGVSSVQRLVSLPLHPGIVVRYLHFEHGAEETCKMLAVATGPADAIVQLARVPIQPMPLSPREMKLAFGLAAGLSLQDMARQGDFSIHTVRNQVKSAMRATGTRSQSQLISLVLDWLQ